MTDTKSNKSNAWEIVILMLLLLSIVINAIQYQIADDKVDIIDNCMVELRRCANVLNASVALAKECYYPTEQTTVMDFNETYGVNQ